MLHLSDLYPHGSEVQPPLLRWMVLAGEGDQFIAETWDVPSVGSACLVLPCARATASLNGILARLWEVSVPAASSALCFLIAGMELPSGQ